ncbi:MAG TPA: BatA and WFA domain-containing protein [Polyangiaceae bacterium]|nr:BatA and WFA domain-containing protein [Polyangiaceae bacterium]
MSFLVAAALGVGLFVVIPIAAHLLRRGRAREREFPPTALVPAARSVARERATLEDRVLLTIRALLIACLTVIGATPFVQCSRLSLNRSAGASVAFALVLDDSHSMRAKGQDGRVRFERALQAARELLASAREGDAIAIVLAGKPARLALAATTDLSAARRALSDLSESDRSTDLEGAVGLARTSIASVPHHDKRVVLLSDLAGPALPEAQPPLWTPVPELATPLENCAVFAAERRGRRIAAHVACTSPAAAAGRALTVVGEKSAAPVPLAARGGIQELGLDLDPKAEHLELELNGGDALKSDDRCPLAAESAALGVLVAVDVSNASAKTGGPPVLEQAVAALESSAALHPIALLPDDPNEYRSNALLLLDDPGGITPEARSALTGFVERGGVAVAFFGPRVDQTPLGATLEPFVHGAVHWQAKDTNEVNAASLSWLGPEASSLQDLKLAGRAGLSTTDLLGGRVLATFSDGQPFLTKRELGRGALFTVALPSSVEHGNFPLRPAFLALLDHFLAEARARHGAAQSVAGSEWTFPASASVTLEGPRGPLALHEGARVGGIAQKAATPTLAARYKLRIDDKPEERVVTIEPTEITTLPQKPPPNAEQARANAHAGSVDASPELGFVALGLLALELGLRVFRLLTRERSLVRDAEGWDAPGRAR